MSCIAEHKLVLGLIFWLVTKRTEISQHEIASLYDLQKLVFFPAKFVTAKMFCKIRNDHKFFKWVFIMPSFLKLANHVGHFICTVYN